LETICQYKTDLQIIVIQNNLSCKSLRLKFLIIKLKKSQKI
jgi:hypothetical protein